MASEQQCRRTGSLSRRRPSSQMLDPLQMPAVNGLTGACMLPNDNAGDMCEDDVVEEGRELFQNFVAEQIKKESPQHAHALEEVIIKTPGQYKYPVWQQTGRDLRRLADEFAHTRERERVREQAAGIDVDMNYEDFRTLLEELFRGRGITSERIVVLFYFCSDVAIRFLQSGTEMFQRFIDWSLNFIVDRVCSWVEGQGGWSKVLSSPFNSVKKVIFWGSLIVLVVFGIRYWRRRT